MKILELKSIITEIKNLTKVFKYQKVLKNLTKEFKTVLSSIF